jgi:hypothetical protein
MTRRNFQPLSVLGSTLRMKPEADSSSRGQKDSICREEMRKAARGHAVRPGNWWSHGSGWKSGFYSLFCVAQGQRCLSGLLGQLSPFGTSYRPSFIRAHFIQKDLILT